MSMFMANIRMCRALATAYDAEANEIGADTPELARMGMMLRRHANAYRAAANEMEEEERGEYAAMKSSLPPGAIG